VKIPFLAWLLQSLPEAIAVVSVTMSLGHGRLYWRLILIIGLIHAVVTYVIRLLPITFWVHTPVLIVSLTVLLSLIGKIQTKKALIFSIISMMILFVTELCFISIWIYFGNFSINELSQNVPVRIATGTPQVLILFLTAFFISKRKMLKNIAN